MHNDQKIYRTFEEFEREELRRLDGLSASVDQMIDAIVGEELELERGSKRASPWDDDEEE